ncbi:MAG TPA: cation:proton antiporter [Gemmata sp.]|nr:cation:proton antiporter [Gemmata sp.]
MNGPPELILTLTGALSAALALGYLTNRLGLSPIVGYLLAGIAIGEYTPGFRADRHLAEQLSQVGVILLMFGVGLHFHVDELLAVRRVALPGAIVQIAAAALLGMAVGLAFGWSWNAAIVFGLSVSVASTVVLTRVLGDRNELHTPLGHTAVGWLVVQDIIAVFVLVLMPAIFGNRGEDYIQVAVLVGYAALKIVAVVLLVLIVGGRVVPWLLHHVAKTHSRELFTLTVLVVAIGIALGSSMLFGVSMPLGAFLAGMVVARSEFSLRAATEALPMRDAFAVLFFVAVGMLFDPGFLLRSPLLFLATFAVVAIGTPVVTCAVMLALGRPVGSAVRMGLALGQIGEFSFIVAQLGSSADLMLLPPEAMNDLVAVAIVTISLNPILYRMSGPLAARLGGWKWLSRRLAVRERLERIRAASTLRPPDDYASERFRAVIVGYGPVGRTLVRLLRENGITPTVIEMNIDTVRQLRADGIRAVYGDAAHSETLKEAGVDRAANLFLTASALSGAGEVVRVARSLNPDVRVLARAAYLRERPELFQAGADEVFASEGEIALAMSENLLRELGASPDQIDRERERVREELFGDGPPPQVPLPQPKDIPTVNVRAPQHPPTAVE